MARVRPVLVRYRGKSRGLRPLQAFPLMTMKKLKKEGHPERESAQRA